MLQIDWLPNKKDTLPLYRQIYSYIKHEIRSGNWPISSKLPAQRSLAAIFKVNRSTVQAAIDELIADGLLESKQGSGIWIANNTWSLFSPPEQIDWNFYVESSTYRPNLPLIQEINRTEFKQNIIRLGTGELAPDLLPHEELTSLMQKTAGNIKSFGYEQPQGLLFLREQLCIHLRKTGINVSPRSILIVSGALQALQLICLGLLPKDSKILLENPSYLLSLPLFQSMQVDFAEVPLDSEGINLHTLAYQQRLKKAALLYTIPTFHNPTSILMTKQRRHDLLQLCRENRLPILEDDVYRDLWLDGPAPPPLKAMDQDGLVLYIGSLSKAVSPGLRIGWVVGPEPVIEKLADMKMQNDYGSSCLSQYAAAEWFASGLHENHLRRVRTALCLKRQTCLDALTQYFKDIASWQIPAGGFYVWLKLKEPISLPKLFKMALAENILLNPGSIYDPLSNRHLRLSYSYASSSELRSALKRVAAMIKQLNK